MYEQKLSVGLKTKIKREPPNEVKMGILGLKCAAGFHFSVSIKQWLCQTCYSLTRHKHAEQEI